MALVLLAQGSIDEIVRPRVTPRYMPRLCAAHRKVAMIVLADVGHGWIAQKSARAAIGWIDDRFRHRAAPDHCGGASNSDATRL